MSQKQINGIKYNEYPVAGANSMDMKKCIGLFAFLIAVGMLLMLILSNDFVGLIIIALLLFIGYSCYCCG